MERRYIIVAPHGDDEIIGCFSLLLQARMKIANVAIFYPNGVECDLAKDYDLDILIHVDEVEHAILDKEFTPTLVAPDPHFELHPMHKSWGAWANDWGCRLNGRFPANRLISLAYYSTNMNAPYIRECLCPDEKRNCLDRYYPGKSDLWRYDHKYFLFEGICQNIDAYFNIRFDK